MRQRLLKVEKLLRDIIHQNMDKDTFVIVDQKPPQHDFFSEQTVIAAGEEQDHYQYKPSKLLKSPSSRAIAVVDRSANIPQAAKDMVSGRSSNSPPTHTMRCFGATNADKTFNLQTNMCNSQYSFGEWTTVS